MEEKGSYKALLRETPNMRALEKSPVTLRARHEKATADPTDEESTNVTAHVCQQSK